MAEPFYNKSSLPWHNLTFLHQRKQLSPFLSESVTVTPTGASLYAIPVEYKDLWKIRAPVRNCEGFDLEHFDKIILVSIHLVVIYKK